MSYQSAREPYFKSQFVNVNAHVQAYLDLLFTFPSDVTATGIEDKAFEAPAKGT